MTESYREHKGYAIEVRDSKQGLELLVDSEQVRHGQLPDGQYFLHEYAYDWTEDLTELARKWIDHRTRADGIRAMANRSEGEVS
jgi:hypothetical protein